ncbi:uncharacterized protein [Diabrotica undecimpunctata]|uniref:uncharacterized protein n=1 Tax=Diabrotica undecimpunctata TaxID=50387 RepID=UPI003B637830
MQLREHLTQVHNTPFSEEILHFNNVEDFEMWLNEISKTKNQEYAKRTTDKISEEIVVTYYNCNRSGVSQVKLSSNKRKRKMKVQGSCKQGIACTSTIQLRKYLKTGQCDVKYVPEHYGHVTELQHLRISQSNKLEIAEKLAMAVPASKILESVRENIEPSLLKRKDLLTRKDIHNIKCTYNIDINSGVRHSIDSVSVGCWVEEFQKKGSNTVFYKSQGAEHDYLNKHDLCLIFMNSTQEYMLKTYGNGGVICVDSTHGLNSYDFELTTILVVDEWGEGFPTACLFTNRKDSEIFKFFFDKIKEKVGIISARTFMTDITNVFYNAWSASMGAVTYQIFCSWHVERAWTSNLNKISDKEKREKVHLALKVIQTELNEINFLKEIQNFVDMLQNDPDLIMFGKYFVDNYINRCEQWAYVYRKTAGVNTNMHLEAMHKCIKYFQLDGKVVKRLDKGVHAVNLYIRDKIIDRMIKQIKGKDTSHLRIIEKRHEMALKSSFQVSNNYENVWHVINNGQQYIVSKKPTQILSCCELKCVKCNICIHTYQCTCIDYFIKGIMCKHIHYIAVPQNKGENNTKVNVIHCIPSISSSTISETESQPGTSSIVRAHKGPDKRDLLKQCGQELTELDLTHVDDSIVEHALKVHRNSINLLKSNLHHDVQSAAVINNKEPANKKIRKQQSFYSTKKKRMLKKPNMLGNSELSSMKSVLLSEKYILTNPSDEHNYVKTMI